VNVAYGFLRLHDFFRGLSYPLRGYRVLREHRELARYGRWPIALTALALIGSLVLASTYHDDLLNWLWDAPDARQHAWLAALHALARALSFVLSLALLVLLCVSFSSVLAAPFNDALSEALEARVAGREPRRFSLSHLLVDVLRTAGLELLKLLLYVSVMGPLWLLSWLVPGVGQGAYMVALVLFTTAYFALDYVDWPAARRGWPIRARLALLGRHPWLMFGFGVAVWACLFVPLLNLVFMPLSVAGGTLLFLDIEARSLREARAN
jgi:CysZ protein